MTIPKPKKSELTLETVLEALLPHNCTTCAWMQPNLTPPKKGQKFCRYPGAITTTGNSCDMWRVEMDPSKRSVDGNWVVSDE